VDDHVVELCSWHTQRLPDQESTPSGR
jgi:hypothetical protein